MRSVKSSVQGWKTVATLLGTLIVLQALGLGAGWSQEPARPRLDEEFTKQEKIYRSRGADVPSGYVTGRTLSDYAAILSSDFCDTLTRLGRSDRWLDIGAGEGQAILDYFAFHEDATLPNCARSWSKASATAMSIEDRRTEAWRRQAAISGDDRLRYVFGKRLSEYSHAELGTFQMITDVYGGFSYTEELSRFLGKTLSLLNVGGVFYTLLQGVHLENGKDKPDTWYLTELVDAAGRDVKACSWLKRTSCVKVGCESKSDWHSPTEVIHIRKICSEVTVPRMKLLQYKAGYPPGRRFQLER